MNGFKFSILWFVLYLTSASVFACKCKFFNEVEKYNRAEQIVLAEVTHVKIVPSQNELQPWDIAETRFEIIESFKNGPLNSNILYAGIYECVPEIVVGEVYVFYISKERGISRCTGTEVKDDVHPIKFEQMIATLRELSLQDKKE
ncbi:hypothetical protein FE810_13845 [Thalassotalea litorea]|uniref:Tissue inhibitor of metalloproteinase n=1 Tax=Thalassotalea litorea TaxID=2020715 RepID=A0A5R9IDC3_9GAMM|nr:hypothetical protein [Thalassotalea litorea]TLU61596.1 hypothetical protein FE810_13845 [Thalassotalea litorea]